MTLTEWLDQQENIDGSLPITMFAMGRSWEGAIYIVDGLVSDQRIYLLGEMPKDAEKLCFRFKNDDREWYVANYFQKDPETLESHQMKYHPFGKNWILHPWKFQKAIDHYANKPYKRIPTSIQRVSNEYPASIQ